MRIAVLDDDQAQTDFCFQTLSPAGHICHAFSSGRELAWQLRRQTFDLLILDWSVSDMSGKEILCWVRGRISERLPVLFMTSRSSEEDIASILNHGADDYVVKPVSGSVLLARVSSLLRRTYQLSAVARENYGDYQFDLIAKQVVFKGTAAALTPKEFELALLLFQHLGRPLSRDHIRDLLWNQVAEISSRTIDTHVSGVRSKLNLRPENGYRLAAVYGYGYRLASMNCVEARRQH